MNMKESDPLTTFTELGLAEPLLRALAAENYQTPTPIQAQSIPHLLAGRDLLGVAQTGTGKTAAFALPILQRLAEGKRAQARTARALILSPTRELATQIADSFRVYGKHLGLKIAVVFGGVGHGPQRDALQRGTDILIATPGRLLDHIEQGNVMLARTEIFVLDEADQMLDMGFIRPIRQIVAKLPARRQSLFFSATMPREMAALAADLLSDPAKVSVAPQATTAERVSQRVIFIETARKRDLLSELLQSEAMGRTLIFTRTKHGADRVAKHLIQTGVPAAAIHGNKSQNARTRALDEFRRGRTPILVATDVAARGIDVEGVTHVINFDLPNVPESYVHRIGRTARAGASGQAIAFCDNDERAYLKDIERITRQTIPSEDRRQVRASAPAASGGQGRPGAYQGKSGQGSHGGQNSQSRQNRQGGQSGQNRQGGQGGQQRRPRRGKRAAAGNG